MKTVATILLALSLLTAAACTGNEADGTPTKQVIDTITIEEATPGKTEPQATQGNSQEGQPGTDGGETGQRAAQTRVEQPTAMQAIVVAPRPERLPTPTGPPTPAATAVPTQTPTLAPTSTPPPTRTPTPTAVPSATPLPTATPTPEPTHRPTATITPFPTPTPLPTPLFNLGGPARTFARHILNIDEDLAATVASYPWVRDGLDDKETTQMVLIRDIAHRDLESAKILADYPYTAQGVQGLQVRASFAVRLLAETDPELARWLLVQPFMEPPFNDRDSFVLEAMSLIALAPAQSNILPLLKSKRWFSDGIGEYQTALLTVMRSLVYISDDYRTALIDTHKIVTRVVDLPLAGESELIVITHEQDVDYDQIFTAMETGARSHENFLGLRFPHNDIIFLVGDDDLWPSRSRGNVLGSDTSRYFALNYPFKISHIYHEMGHFYLHGAANRWLIEGGTSFLESVAEIAAGGTTSEEQIEELDRRARTTSCPSNIRESLVDWKRSNCDYYLGERFFWKAYVALGEETVAATMMDLLATYEETGRMTDEDVYRIFLKNAPTAKKNEFNRVYQVYHGGPVPNE